jgi:hypothetical protein
MSKTEHNLTEPLQVTVTDQNGKCNARVWVPNIIVDVNNNHGSTPNASLWIGVGNGETSAASEYFHSVKRTYLTFSDGLGGKVVVEVDMTPEQIIEALQQTDYIGEPVREMATA